jgi:hypothetical protein
MSKKWKNGNDGTFRDDFSRKYERPNVIVNDDLFDSGWVTHEKPKLYISEAIVGVCNAIQEKFPSLEWAILLKGEWTKLGFVIGNTYAIPKQEVTSGFVYFDDADKERHIQDGFNVILHSHHNMGIGFSGSDHSTLTDSSFAASLLYSKEKITEATCSIIVKPGVRVAVSPTIVVVGFRAEIPDWIDKVITRKAYQYTNNYKSDLEKAYDKPKENKKILIKCEDGCMTDIAGTVVLPCDIVGKEHEYQILTEEQLYEEMRGYNVGYDGWGGL